MTTKFRQKICENCTYFNSVQGRETFFCTYDRVFGIGEFKYAIQIFQGANDIAMATKFRQKKNKIAILGLGRNFGPMQNTFGICVQRICFGSLNSLMLNTVKIVLPWQLNFEKKLH